MLFLSNQHIDHVTISIIRTWRTLNCYLKFAASVVVNFFERFSSIDQSIVDHMRHISTLAITIFFILYGHKTFVTKLSWSNAVCTSVHITLFSFHHYSNRAGLTLFSAYLALILTPLFMWGAVRRGDMWEVLFWSTHDWITMEGSSREDSRTENFKLESFHICTASCLCSSDFHYLLNSVHNSEYLVCNVV